MNPPSYQERMRRKLEAALQPIHMEIKDDSARHKGHAGHDPRGETHFIIAIVSEKFAGLDAVARHRLVYGIVAEEMQERVHALNLNTTTPSEYNHR